MEKMILEAFADSAAVKEKFVKTHLSLISKVSSVIAEAFSEGNKLYLFGNGGSSCDASHITAEFVNRFKKDRPGLPAITLNTDMAVLTSIANDYDFSDIFARQLKTLAADGDMVIAISTSGNSQNVIKALDVAK